MVKAGAGSNPSDLQPSPLGRGGVVLVLAFKHDLVLKQERVSSRMLDLLGGRSSLGFKL